MTQDLKNALKIILNAYKEDKFTEEEVFTLLDSMINTNNGGGVVTYPVTYPSTRPWNPWDNQPMFDLKPYCTTTTNTFENNKNEGQTKTTITG